MRDTLGEIWYTGQGVILSMSAYEAESGGVFFLRAVAGGMYV